MRMKLIFSIISIGILLWLPLAAQEEIPDWECGLEYNPETEQIDLTQLGGIYITSTGVVKALVVFVQFSDDSDPNNHWSPQQPPIFMNNIIDSDVNQNSTNYLNFTNFFSQMSFGLLKVIGEAKHIILPNTQQWYKVNKPQRRLIIKEVLTSLDNEINYYEYDNWSSSDVYDHENTPDGVVDMVIVVFRNTAVLNWWWSGEASLGYGSSYTVENGNVTIKTGFGLNSGSGVTSLYKSYWDKYFFSNARHEFSHWLLGRHHPHNGTQENQYWGLLSSARCANAFERERLGWINVPEITGDLSAPLADYITQGVAYKYHPPNGYSNGDDKEYLYFENHQKISVYDDIILNSSDKGIAVLHQKRKYVGNEDVLQFHTADGYRDWENPFWVPIPWKPGYDYPAMRPIGWNIDGYNHRDALPHSQGGFERFDVLAYEDDSYEWGSFHLTREPFEATFNTTHNDVFSPASNPNSNTWNNQPTSFAMEVINQNGSVLNVEYYITDPYEGKPAIPRDLQVSNYNNHPYLTWDTNTEPDLRQYNVYKKKGNDPFTYYTWVNKRANYFVDYNEEVVVGPYYANESIAKYKVTAVDNDLKESNYSNTVKIRVQGGGFEKPIVNDPQDPLIEDNDIIPTAYTISQNYPNPFNPETNIKFGIPDDNFVNLVVFNIQGEKVATLVNEQLTAGTYTAKFDGTMLPSGVYIYKVKAGAFSEIKSMVLVK